MFINFSNHPYALWSAEQTAAAQRYGTVVDLAFPAIDPAADEAALDSLATVYADHILSGRVHLCVPGSPASGSRGHPHAGRLLPPQESGDHLPGRQHPEAQHFCVCRVPALWPDALKSTVRGANLLFYRLVFPNLAQGSHHQFPTFIRKYLLFLQSMCYIYLVIAEHALKNAGKEFLFGAVLLLQLIPARGR